MIETIEDCRRFLEENRDGDWIVHAVPVEDGVHPSSTRPSIIFIKNISTGRTYYYACDHPDSIHTLDASRIKQELFTNPSKIKWAIDKKSFCQLYNLPNVHDANLCGFLKTNETEEISEFETPTHNLIRRNSAGHSELSKAMR